MKTRVDQEIRISARLAAAGLGMTSHEQAFFDLGYTRGYRQAELDLSSLRNVVMILVNSLKLRESAGLELTKAEQLCIATWERGHE